MKMQFKFLLFTVLFNSLAAFANPGTTPRIFPNYCERFYCSPATSVEDAYRRGHIISLVRNHSFVQSKKDVTKFRRILHMNLKSLNARGLGRIFRRSEPINRERLEYETYYVLVDNYVEGNMKTFTTFIERLSENSDKIFNQLFNEAGIYIDFDDLTLLEKASISAIYLEIFKGGGYTAEEIIYNAYSRL